MKNFHLPGYEQRREKRWRREIDDNAGKPWDPSWRGWRSRKASTAASEPGVKSDTARKWGSVFDPSFFHRKRSERTRHRRGGSLGAESTSGLGGGDEDRRGRSRARRGRESMAGVERKTPAAPTGDEARNVLERWRARARSKGRSLSQSAMSLRGGGSTSSFGSLRSITDAPPSPGQHLSLVASGVGRAWTLSTHDGDSDTDAQRQTFITSHTSPTRKAARFAASPAGSTARTPSPAPESFPPRGRSPTPLFFRKTSTSRKSRFRAPRPLEISASTPPSLSRPRHRSDQRPGVSPKSGGSGENLSYFEKNYRPRAGPSTETTAPREAPSPKMTRLSREEEERGRSSRPRRSYARSPPPPRHRSTADSMSAYDVDSETDRGDPSGPATSHGGDVQGDEGWDPRGRRLSRMFRSLRTKARGSSIPADTTRQGAVPSTSANDTRGKSKLRKTNKSDAPEVVSGNNVGSFLNRSSNPEDPRPGDHDTVPGGGVTAQNGETAKPSAKPAPARARFADAASEAETVQFIRGGVLEGSDESQTPSDRTAPPEKKYKPYRPGVESTAGAWTAGESQGGATRPPPIPGAAPTTPEPAWTGQTAGLRGSTGNAASSSGLEGAPTSTAGATGTQEAPTGAASSTLPDKPRVADHAPVAGLPSRRFRSGVRDGRSTMGSETGWDPISDYYRTHGQYPTERELVEFLTQGRRTAHRELMAWSRPSLGDILLGATTREASRLNTTGPVSTGRRGTLRDWWRSRRTSPASTDNADKADSRVTYGNEEWFEEHLRTQYERDHNEFLSGAGPGAGRQGREAMVQVRNPMAMLAFAKPAEDFTTLPSARDSGVSIGTETTIGDGSAPTTATTATHAASDSGVDLSTAEGPSLPGTGFPREPSAAFSEYMAGYGLNAQSRYGPAEWTMPGGDSHYQTPAFPSSLPQTIPPYSTMPTNSPYGFQGQGIPQYPHFSGLPSSLFDLPQSQYNAIHRPGFQPRTNPYFNTSAGSTALPGSSAFTGLPADLTQTMRSASHNLALANPSSGVMAGVKTDLSRILSSGLADEATRTNDLSTVERLTSTLGGMVQQADSVLTQEMSNYKADQYSNMRALEQGLKELKKAHTTAYETLTSLRTGTGPNVLRKNPPSAFAPRMYSTGDGTAPTNGYSWYGPQGTADTNGFSQSTFGPGSRPFFARPVW